MLEKCGKSHSFVASQGGSNEQGKNNHKAGGEGFSDSMESDVSFHQPKGHNMVDVQIPEMMEAGAHFGHQTRRWNPKMKPYLYGARSGVHIIDLQKTQDLASQALKIVVDIVGKGGDVLFVGTKSQARNVVKEQAERSEMFYVNNRWMGGTLTNYQTIKNSIDRLIDYETRREGDGFEGYTKKELLDIDRTIEKLTASLGGIKKMKGVPGLLFVIDPNHEKIAISEARKLGIPVIAMVDSNCDPDPIDYVIPSNDDAISSIEYFTTKLADACLEGLEKREEEAQKAGAAEKAAPKKPARKSRVAKGETTGRSYVAKSVKEQSAETESTEGGFSAKAEEKKEEKKTDEEVKAS